MIAHPLRVAHQQHQPEALVEEGAGDGTAGRHPCEPVLQTVQHRLDPVVHEGEAAELLADAPEGGQGPLGQAVLAGEAPIELAGDPGHLTEEGVAQPLHLLRQIARARPPGRSDRAGSRSPDARRPARRDRAPCGSPPPTGGAGAIQSSTASRVAGNEGGALPFESLAERVQLRGHGLGALLRDGVATQEAHPAGEADALRLLLEALEHLDRLRVADPLGAQGHQVLGGDIGAEGQVLGGELLASGPDPDIQVDRHQAVEYLRRVHGASLPEGARAGRAAEHGRRCRR